jgi:hypothetical protein
MGTHIHFAKMRRIVSFSRSFFSIEFVGVHMLLCLHSFSEFYGDVTFS